METFQKIKDFLDECDKTIQRIDYLFFYERVSDETYIPENLKHLLENHNIEVDFLKDYSEDAFSIYCFSINEKPIYIKFYGEDPFGYDWYYAGYVQTYPKIETILSFKEENN